MASGQRSVSEYFPVSDSERSRGSQERKEGDSNPSKRTRSELSSMGSDISDTVNQRILDDLNEIKSDLKKTVKTTELDKVVRKVVGEMVDGLKKDFNKKLEDQKKEYDTKIVDLKMKIDSLNVEKEELKGRLQTRLREVTELEKSVRKVERVANKARVKANRNEQYSRKTNVKLHGVEDVKLESGQVLDTQRSVRHILRKAVNVEVADSEIIACHRIPGGSGSIRPILLKVRNTEVKSRIMRKRADFKKAKKGYKLSDDVTKDNADLITNLLKQDHVEQAWFFNCNVYAKLKDTDGKKEVPRVMFDINDNIEKKIKKRLKPRDESDPHSGYATDSESESE